MTLDAFDGELGVPDRPRFASVEQVAVRTELHPIRTLTISDRQFLIGDADGAPVTICGQLRIAQGTGRLSRRPPARIDGYGANIDVW